MVSRKQWVATYRVLLLLASSADWANSVEGTSIYKRDLTGRQACTLLSCYVQSVCSVIQLLPLHTSMTARV